MKSLLSVDFTELFATPPPVEGLQSQPGPGQRSRHTGFCWFAGPDYPDTGMLREHVRNADAPSNADETSAPGADFARALAKSAFNMSTDTSEDEPNPHVISQDWDTAISSGPSEAKRQYLLESFDRNLVFTGSACLGSIVELMEIAMALAVFGVDLNSDSPGPGGPWHYELLSAGDSATLQEAVADCRKEHDSEHWLACGHHTGDAISFALFYAKDASHDLACTFEELLMPTKARADDTRQCFRAILFWRDAASTAAQ